MNEPTFRPVPAVERAIELLRAIEVAERPMGISELARTVGASKGTVREILETLRSHRLLERDDTTKLYVLGPGLIRLGGAAAERLDLLSVAQPVMADLAAQCQEMALFLVRDQDRLLIQHVSPPPSPRIPMLVSATPGHSFDVTAGACGKVVMAMSGPQERAELLAGMPAYTAATRRPGDLERELEEVRQRGYATDDEEFMEGVRGVSSPILADGRLQALLLVSGVAASLTRERLEEVGEQVHHAAEAISRGRGVLEERTVDRT